MQSTRISRRHFLAMAGAVGSASLLAACGPAPSGGAGASEAAAGQAPAQAARTLIVNAYVPTQWTERSSEHPTVVNARASWSRTGKNTNRTSRRGIYWLTGR